ncbi:MAG: DUF4392 domain-containing protein [Alphaproteobacteria bacterium]|nr:DUF4392 domain-containing protein [Alphaproteobacteria bacterium]
MSPRRSESDALDAIEALVCRDVGRGTAPLIAATRGDLAAAARALADATSVGMITGFYVPRGETPGPETDGPPGAALLAGALAACGVPARIAVDGPCAEIVKVAVAAVGEARVAVDVVVDLDDAIDTWIGAGISHALSIERCGRSRDGKPRNMRGVDVSSWTLALDDLFTAAPWVRLAVGDGGNEIGMGKLAPDLIGGCVPNGTDIASVTAADHLVVAGVSNWGAYGLIAAMAVLRPDWRAALLSFLDPEREFRLVRRLVTDAGAIDGVTARREPTVDGLPADEHAALLRQLYRIAGGETGL